MKFINKSLYFLFIVIGAFLRAAEQPPAPPTAAMDGGGGGVGPGGNTSPIDMYVYFLVFIAVFFIIYYAKKLNKKIA